MFQHTRMSNDAAVPRKLMEEIDVNNDGLISQQEFMLIMQKPEAFSCPHTHPL